MPIDHGRGMSRAQRRAHIDALKDRAAELTGGRMVGGTSSDCPPEIEEQFWEHVVAFEQADAVPLFDLLVARGVTLPPPEELNDAQLKDKLREVIHALAGLGTYLHSTDHLSDRELYTHLWSESLREPTVIMPENPDFAYHIDLIGSGSEEDTFLYLKHYAEKRLAAAGQPTGLMTRSPTLSRRPSIATATCRGDRCDVPERAKSVLRHRRDSGSVSSRVGRVCYAPTTSPCIPANPFGHFAVAKRSPPLAPRIRRSV